MKLVTKYQISAINSCREKCDEKYLGRTEGTISCLIKRCQKSVLITDYTLPGQSHKNNGAIVVVW
jgi:hypothetical protein